VPDYPYVYAEGPVRPIQPGATRLRVFRRGPRREGEPESPITAAGSTRDDRDTRWRRLLEAAVGELNATLRKAGAPYVCHLEEDEAGFLLKVIHRDGEPLEEGPDEVDEVLEPEELPAMLARLRTRLGILVDERV
jgi:hypothetical protein